MTLQELAVGDTVVFDGKQEVRVTTYKGGEKTEKLMLGLATRITVTKVNPHSLRAMLRLRDKDAALEEVTLKFAYNYRVKVKHR